MSKELSPLEILGKIHDCWNCCNPNSNGCTNNDFKIIETALKENEYLKTELLGQRQELNVKNKALKIIRKKIDVGVVILGDKPKIRITYNGQLRFYDIAQEEYDLLKEELL